MTLSAIALPQKVACEKRRNLRVKRNKKVGHNEQLRVSPLRLVFTFVAHMKRFMQTGTKHSALYDQFHDSPGLVLGEWAIAESVKCRVTTWQQSSQL